MTRHATPAEIKSLLVDALTCKSPTEELTLWESILGAASGPTPLHQLAASYCSFRRYDLEAIKSGFDKTGGQVLALVETLTARATKADVGPPEPEVVQVKGTRCVAWIWRTKDGARPLVMERAPAFPPADDPAVPASHWYAPDQWRQVKTRSVNEDGLYMLDFGDMREAKEWRIPPCPQLTGGKPSFEDRLQIPCHEQGCPSESVAECGHKTMAEEFGGDLPASDPPLVDAVTAREAARELEARSASIPEIERGLRSGPPYVEATATPSGEATPGPQPEASAPSAPGEDSTPVDPGDPRLGKHVDEDECSHYHVGPCEDTCPCPLDCGCHPGPGPQAQASKERTYTHRCVNPLCKRAEWKDKLVKQTCPDCKEPCAVEATGSGDVEPAPPTVAEEDASAPQEITDDPAAVCQCGCAKVIHSRPDGSCSRCPCIAFRPGDPGEDAGLVTERMESDYQRNAVIKFLKTVDPAKVRKQRTAKSYRQCNFCKAGVMREQQWVSRKDKTSPRCHLTCFEEAKKKFGVE